MKYESNILKRLIDTYGVVGNPRYISEIIKEFIVRGKECFPNLFTYQSDWLAHIDEFGLNPTYTVSYTGQSFYAPNTLERPVKSANLKGSTKYRDIDTGEFLETFEEGRNLELVSVKMPVLKAANSNNLIDTNPNSWHIIDGKTQVIQNKPIEVQPNTTYSFFINMSRWGYIFKCDEFGNTSKQYIGNNKGGGTFVTDDDCYYIIARNDLFADVTRAHTDKMRLFPGTKDLGYTGYVDEVKSNILTVNEDVTLRSNGSVCDELDLLTGKLTQRIDEDGEILVQEVVKTVDLTILDQNGQIVEQLMAFNGGTHFNTGSLEGSPLPSVSVSVETDLEKTLKVCSIEGNTM